MYDIAGFRTVKKDTDKLPKYGYVKYAGIFCNFSIATDCMGTQICYSGTFFGPSFPNIDTAVIWMNADPTRQDAARKVFRRAYFKNLQYLVSWRRIRYIYWKIRNYFQPDFYLR